MYRYLPRRRAELHIKENAAKRALPFAGGTMSSCLKKVRHRTKERAEAAAAKYAEERGARTRAYSCSHCGGWHLTGRV